MSSHEIKRFTWVRRTVGRDLQLNWVTKRIKAEDKREFNSKHPLEAVLHIRAHTRTYTSGAFVGLANERFGRGRPGRDPPRGNFWGLCQAIALPLSGQIAAKPRWSTYDRIISVTLGCVAFLVNIGRWVDVGGVQDRC